MTFQGYLFIFNELTKVLTNFNIKPYLEHTHSLLKIHYVHPHLQKTTTTSALNCKKVDDVFHRIWP